MKIILAAILWLAPFLTQGEAQLYAKLVDYHAARINIPPLLMVAIVQQESGWNRKATSPVIAGHADYGLAQVRVSKTQHANLIGHEHLLHDPVINLYLATNLMKYWRDYHYAKCWPHHTHPWYSHLGWGHKVKDGGKRARERVGKLYEKLLAKFGTPQS
jgi:hypothetical protein